MTPTRSPYLNRGAAGDVLAGLLDEYAGRDDVVVLGLPRGGVPVAARIAERLAAPLDVVIVRKLGVPGRPELAMGALAATGQTPVVVRNAGVIEDLAISESQFAEVRDRELGVLTRRRAVLREQRPGVELGDRVVIVVDDGLATGSTMRAALAAVRRHQPSRVVVAVPIGAARQCAELRATVGDLVCPWVPDRFVAVGQGYLDFGPVPDRAVINLLAAAG